MLKVKSNNVVRQLPEMKELCQPNLLDNADFKSGIINQRGQSSYTTVNKTTYMIDRWRTFYGMLEVNDGYVKFTNTDSSSARAFEQWFSDFGDGTFTVYVNAKSLSGNVRIQLLDNDSSVIEEKQLVVGENLLTADGAVRGVRFYVLIGANIELYQVKLEKGSIFTGMPQWDERIEYLKCRKYFYTLGGGWNNMFHTRTDENYISIYIPILTPMAKTPSLVDYANENSSSKMVSIRGNDIAQGTSLSVPISEFTQSANKTLVTLSAPLNGRSQIGYGGAVFRFACGLDAETY